MKRSYSQGWADIFGKDLPKKPTAQGTGTSVKTPKPKAGEPEASVDASTVNSADIDWKKTRALSIRQPWAELIMRGVKETEFREGLTRIRGRIAIYASLGRYPKQDEEVHESELGLSIEDLPRGVIVGTVELYDCDGGDWYLREPKRMAEPIKPTKHPQPIWFYPFGRD